MQEQLPPQFDWAHDAFLTLSGEDYLTPSNRWSAFEDLSATPVSTFIFPSLLSTDFSTISAVTRHGQITPPDDGSRKDSCDTVSINDTDKLPAQHNPEHHHPQSTKLVHIAPQTQTGPSAAAHPLPPTDKPVKKRSRSTKSQAPQNNGQDQPLGEHASPPKRRRGRPTKVQPKPPQTTADSLTSPISSTRETHLEKNRVAAHKCRQRKKEYVNSLDTRFKEASGRNKELREQINQLRDEVLDLKTEVLRHAGCGNWTIDNYLARCAGELVGVNSTFRSGSKPSLARPNTASGASNLMSSMILEDFASSEGSPNMSLAEYNALDLPSPTLGSEMGDMDGMEFLEDMGGGEDAVEGQGT